MYQMFSEIPRVVQIDNFIYFVAFAVTIEF